MKRYIFPAFFLSIVFLSGCSFWNWDPAPMDREAAEKFTQGLALSWVAQTWTTQTGSSIQAGSGNSSRTNKPVPISLSWTVRKPLLLSKPDEGSVRSILRTPLSECSDPKFLENVRSIFSKLNVPEAVKKWPDAMIVDRCKIRATLRETGKCSGLSGDSLKACEGLKSAIATLSSKERKNDPVYFTARNVYQLYFIDFEKFPPSEFVKTDSEAKK